MKTALALLSMGVLLFALFVILTHPQAPAAPAPETIVQPINDGNGIYYFPVTGEQYRHALSQFYADNPGFVCEYQGATEVQRITVFVIGGHILHCRDSAVPAQDTTVP